jgi:hypothetical protein
VVALAARRRERLRVLHRRLNVRFPPIVDIAIERSVERRYCTQMLFLLALVASVQQPLKCDENVLYPVANDEAAARRIAIAVIASRPDGGLPNLFKHPGTPR